MTYYCRIVILSLLILFFSGCETGNQSYSLYNQKKPANNHFNYLTVQTANLPDFLPEKNKLISDLLFQLTNSDYPSQFISSHQSNLQPIHHFYWTRSDQAKTNFIYLQPIVGNLPLPDSSSLPANLSFFLKDNWLVISNQPQSELPEIIAPPANSFLTIHSLDLPLPTPDLIPETDLSSLALIDTIQNIIDHESINFFWLNRQILINQTKYQTPQPETKLLLRSENLDSNLNIHHQVLLKKILAVFSVSYLDNSLLKPDLFSNLQFQFDHDDFSFFLGNNSDQEQPINCQTIINHLQETKTYFPQYKNLPDNTPTLILSPGPEKLDLQIGNQQISYINQQQNKIYLHCLPTKLQITTQPAWLNQPVNVINLPWSNLKTVFPNLPEQFNFIKSIQLNYQNDRFTGLVVK